MTASMLSYLEYYKGVDMKICYLVVQVPLDKVSKI